METVFTEFQKLNGTTWLYLAFLLSIAVFFKFTRFFCLRNWDLITLFLVAPGLLATARVDKRLLQMLEQARTLQQVGQKTPPLELDAGSIRQLQLGYLWLFVASAYLLVRCLIDLFLARRPRLDPNLDVAGLAFLGVSLLGFLMFEVVTKEPDPAGRASALVAGEVLSGSPREVGAQGPPVQGTIHPGTTLYHAVVFAAVDTLMQRLNEQPALLQSDLAVGVARSAAILAHLFILTALVLIGWQIFGAPEAGVGMATLYLLLPLTAINVEKIDHLLPSALLIWAVYFHRRPVVSGALLGVASAFVFPLFLAPLWLGYYGRRGAGRCLAGFLGAAAVVGLVVFLSDSVRDFVSVWSSSVAWKASQLGQPGHSLGFWTETTQYFRLPIFVVYMFFVVGAAFWPAQKNLADLIALSAAIILGAQFWYPDRGGSYVAWYLPLFLAMMFRPNLQAVCAPDTVAPLRKRGVAAR
jgi:hypothetical protein